MESWPNTEDAKNVLQDWLTEIKRELRLDTYMKSQHYSYDFERDQPIHNPDGRFVWTVSKELSTLPPTRTSNLSTFSSLNYDEPTESSTTEDLVKDWHT